jgi:hypothetical protein
VCTSTGSQSGCEPPHMARKRPMTELLLITVLAFALGLQSGWIASGSYHNRSRDK